MSKLRIFLNWIVTVILGSAINTAIAESTFYSDIFMIFLIASAAIGVIPLIIMLVLHHNQIENSEKNLRFKVKLIASQLVSYLGIFTTLFIINGTNFSFDYLIFLVGLSYLFVGIVLTILPSKSKLAIPNKL